MKTMNSAATRCTKRPSNTGYPIAKKIQGVVFTDVGNAWGGVENIPWYHENNKLHYSGGLGFRITTPIGPIRLDYGVGQDGGKFHFSFGGKF